MDAKPENSAAIIDAQPKIRALARQLCPSGGTDAIDDLTSVGNIALMRKIGQFDPSVGSLFTFAQQEITRAIRRAMRRYGRKDMKIGINNTKTRIEYTSGGMFDGVSDVASLDPTPEDQCFENERGSILRGVLSLLTPREHLVIRRRYFGARECRQEDLANELGISSTRVQQIEAGALSKLRESLGPQAKELLG